MTKAVNLDDLLAGKVDGYISGPSLLYEGGKLLIKHTDGRIAEVTREQAEQILGGAHVFFKDPNE